MRKVAYLLLAYSGLAFGQAPSIKAGATVYIKPMGGYETYLAAAFTKKHVPLVIVSVKDKARYIITSTIAHKDLSAGGPVAAVTVNNEEATTPASRVETAAEQGYAAGVAEKLAFGETSAGIAVIDKRTSDVVFAYTAGKMGKKQLQRTADACANHLKKFIEKSNKRKKKK